MNTERAAENLELIRTLMERSALYRRALAPLMLWSGTLGCLGGVAGWWWGYDDPRRFVELWYGVSILALGGCLYWVRRQAMHDGEPFWSPPTRQVLRAMIPGLAVGAIYGLGPGLQNTHTWGTASLWICLYGVALHSAAHFITRGTRWFGWCLVCLGSAGLLIPQLIPGLPYNKPAHLLMGTAFGLAHLAYGTYLRATEPRELQR